FDRSLAPVPTATERNKRNERRRLRTRKTAHTLECLLVEGLSLLFIQTRSFCLDRGFQKIARRKTQIVLDRLSQTAHKQYRADQKHERKCELRDHEDIAQSQTPQ